ncbi:unnamed protein product [Schistosoma rodhaini]|uniref:Uncharacterized protein n=1 Tax=Schistosoma rodhaini TaxID=6188 RepID=A0AA85FCS3_9TREM|nr:unnamed protein product [Schistosoma rodhaini]
MKAVILIFTTLLSSTYNTVERNSSKTDDTQSLTTSDNIMTSGFNEDSTRATLMQLDDLVSLTLFNFTDPGTTAYDVCVEMSDTFRAEG